MDRVPVHAVCCGAAQSANTMGVSSVRAAEGSTAVQRLGGDDRQAVASPSFGTPSLGGMRLTYTTVLTAGC